MPSSKVIEAIAVTAELCGRTFTPAAAAVFASDLDGFNDHSILAALTRCRKELKGMLTVQDVIARIDDGRPGIEQAWAMLPFDESQTVVWTSEMSQAWGVANMLLTEGDKIGARMAFKETYSKLLADARDKRIPVQWYATLGHDKFSREAPLIAAVEKGWLSAPHVQALLPNHEISQSLSKLLESVKLKRIAA